MDKKKDLSKIKVVSPRFGKIVSTYNPLEGLTKEQIASALKPLVQDIRS